MKRFAGDLFAGMELTPADKNAIVHAFDVDDTLTRKPEGFDNTGLTKDQFFDAARSFPPDQAVVELAQLLASKGDRIAIATARPAERLDETIDWLQRNNVPFDQIMLSTGGEPSGVAKQAMLQKLQEDYKQVGTLFDDSPYNVQGAQMQGIPAVHLRKNDEYWAQHPERVFPYWTMTYQDKQLSKIYKHLLNAELCRSREEAQEIIRKYDKRVAKLNKVNALNSVLDK